MLCQNSLLCTNAIKWPVFSNTSQLDSTIFPATNLLVDCCARRFFLCQARKRAQTQKTGSSRFRSNINHV
jgi:hypothetical protein